MQRSSVLNSVSGRLMIFGGVPALLVIAALVTLSAIDGYRSAVRSAHELLRADALGAAAELSTRNDRWNSTAQMISRSQSSGFFGKRAETIELLREWNSISALNLSMFIVYEPNADGADEASLGSGKVPAKAMDSSGRFVPLILDVFVGGVRTGETAVRPSVGMETLEYYSGPKGAFARTGDVSPLITEPFEQEGEQIFSHACPIVVDGRFVGVAGVNRTLGVLTSIAQSIKERSHADVFILSRGGAFIAATTDDPRAGRTELIGRAISATSHASSAATWISSGSASGRVFQKVDPDLGVECLYAAEPVAVGGWTVVVRRAKSDVLADAWRSLYRNLAMGLVGICVVGGLGLVVTLRVAARIRGAAEAADRIARGDLTHAIEQSTSGDESGQLMRSMHTMDANLNSLVGNVKQASIRLNSTATEIAATSRQQEASSATFGAASNQIAAAVMEISATGRDLVKTMESVDRMAAETATLAGAGQTSLQSMEGVMRDLDAATGSVSDKLNAINERSQKITSVVTTITKVADQTNILSINAAIEAEKAGEYGSGFLVIAREIRRLADQTASATMDIEQMVQQMQGAVSSGVMEMDRFADQVRRGVREVALAGSQLTEIIDRVNRSTESFKQVNESMRAQSEGAQQISEAMGSLVSNANQTVQSVKEFSQAASDLQSAISLLRDTVAQFKLRER